VTQAIKYGVWGSNPEENEIVSNLYEKSREAKVDLVLLFGSTKNAMIFGAARVTSAFEPQSRFPLWWHKTQEPGLFHLSWLYIKLFNLAGFTDFQE